MKEYLVLLILSYFKFHIVEYDLDELMKRLGVSFEQFSDLLDYLFREELLEYRDSKMSLSFKGRMLLMNSDMEYYNETDDVNSYLFQEKWPVDRPFSVHCFSKKKWRGNN